MKKFITAVLLITIAAAVYAAAPVWKHRVKVVGDVVADSQWTSKWEAIANIIWVSTDSSYQIMRISGTALLDPGEVLYLGASDDSAGVGGVPIYDTSIVSADGLALGQAGGRIYVPFSFIYRDSQITQTDITDTTFFWMASKSKSSKVDVLGLTVDVTVTELNAADD